MREFLRLSAGVCSRHMTIYRQDFFANMAPTLIDPLMFIVAFGIGLGSYVTEVGDTDYMHYMAPGLAITTALFTAFFETSYGFFIRLKFDHVYKAMLTTPVGVPELIAGEYMWVAMKGAIMSTGVSLVMWAFGLVAPDFLFAIPFVGAVVAVACGSLGFMASALVKNINQFQTVYALLISPMFFFSGVFYPVEGLPEGVRVASNFSPLYHGVRIGQELLWAKDLSVIPFHGAILMVMIAVLVAGAVRLVWPKLYQ